MDKADQEVALGWAFTEEHVLFRFHAHLEMRFDKVTKAELHLAGAKCEVLEDYPTRREGRTKVLLGFTGPMNPSISWSMSRPSSLTSRTESRW